MEWYNAKEKSAGEKRLMITWKLYKFLGTRIVLFIAFFVSLITYLTNKDLRKYSKKYFDILYSFTQNKKYKPSELNTFKHIYSYAESLVYKMKVFASDFDENKIIFNDKNAGEELFENIKNRRGSLFICNHIGNIEMLRAFLIGNKNIKPASVSIFMQKQHCSVFNNFINKISSNNEKVKTYPIEEIDIATISELDDDLKNGGIAFIAGDRISAKNPEKHIEADFLNSKIYLPLGTFKMAKILNCDTYFISAIKNKIGYEVYIKKITDFDEKNLYTTYAEFIERMTLKAPYQFYHFYDVFKQTACCS